MLHLKPTFSNYFFFFEVFLVAFLALGCFIPQAMPFSPPPSILYIDLFIPFNLIFVKSFFMDALSTEGDKASSQFSDSFLDLQVINAIEMGQISFSKGNALPLRK